MKLSALQTSQKLLRGENINIEDIDFGNYFSQLDKNKDLIYENKKLEYLIKNKSIKYNYTVRDLGYEILSCKFGQKYFELGITILEKIRDYQTIAIFLFEGKTLNQNIDLGLDYYFKSIYEEGGYDLGLEDSTETYLEKFANSGFTKAQYMLGFLYFYGYRTGRLDKNIRLIKNKTKSVQWINKAIKNNYLEAFKLKADFELNRNKLKSAKVFLIKYFKKTFGKSFKNSMIYQYLYDYSYRLIQIENNEKFAIECLELIANEGFKLAQKILSEFYMNGIIVRRNKATSLAWYKMYVKN
ncbi:MAG: hypothetical protein RLZZ175_3053 [Bacteroidota bacterium]|jgi:TPR repeat protein